MSAHRLFVSVSLLAAGACDPAPVTPDAGSDTCAAAASELRELFCGDLWTVAVRLDAVTGELASYAVTCGASAPVTEGTALGRLLIGPCRLDVGMEGEPLHRTDPADVYVFGFLPADFGGIGLVSVNGGHVAFAATMLYGGTGEVVCPAEWRPATELASGCPIDKLSEFTPQSFVVDGTLRHLPDARLGPPTDAVYETAVPFALRDAGAVLGISYAFVAYDAGAPIATKREWVVVFVGQAD